MKIKHTFIDVATNTRTDNLLIGEYQVIGDPKLIVRPSVDDHNRGDKEYEFIYRVGRVV